MHAAPLPGASNRPRRAPAAGRAARRASALVAVLLALGAATRQAAAQKTGVVAGRIVDDSGAAVRDAQVTVRGRAAPAVTDSAGRYRLADVKPGTLVMQVKAVGYASASRIVDVAAGTTTTLDVSLSRAQELAEVVVAASPVRHDRRYDEFEERRKNGRGQYLTREQIEKSNVSTLNDLLRRLRGIQMDCQGGGCFIRMARSPIGCLPQYIVDGRPQDEFGPSTPLNDIQGIEVYTGSSETPAEFVGEGGCGTVVIWTKSSP